MVTYSRQDKRLKDKNAGIYITEKRIKHKKKLTGGFKKSQTLKKKKKKLKESDYEKKMSQMLL